MEQNVRFSISGKVLAATALGAGILIGAGAAYILIRIHDHSNLTYLVSCLHETIREVREEISNIENELGLQLCDKGIQATQSKLLRSRKGVSFSSNATTTTYKTTLEQLHDGSCVNATDADSCKSHHTCDTENLSLDDDEFFDVIPSGDDERELDEFSPYESGIINDDGGISAEVCELRYLIKKVDCLVEKSTECQIKAYNLLMERGCKYDNNAEILWRKARNSRCMGAIEEFNDNPDGKKEYIEEGYEFAKRALEINDKSSDCHKWYAILAGARGEYLPVKERIANGHIFKQHIDIALQLCPNDSTLHHLLGRFCYEVSSMSWVEKKVASALFGEVPVSSYEEALGHFIAADELKQDGWKENKFYVAKCYFKLLNLENGKSWLKCALAIPSINADDELINKEILEMMDEY